MSAIASSSRAVHHPCKRYTPLQASTCHQWTISRCSLSSPVETKHLPPSTNAFGNRKPRMQVTRNNMSQIETAPATLCFVHGKNGCGREYIRIRCAVIDFQPEAIYGSQVESRKEHPCTCPSTRFNRISGCRIARVVAILSRLERQTWAKYSDLTSGRKTETQCSASCFAGLLQYLQVQSGGTKLPKTGNLFSN